MAKIADIHHFPEVDQFVFTPKVIKKFKCDNFFFYLGFLSDTLTIQRIEGKLEAIYLTPLYHFHLLHRYVDISRVIAAESSPLHIVSSRTRTGNLWFPSASC